MLIGKNGARAPMIYGRFGDIVEILRTAVLADVGRLEGRTPDKADREAIENGSYVVVMSLDDRKERLYHQAYLRADGGAVTIGEAIEKADRAVRADSARSEKVEKLLDFLHGWFLEGQAAIHAGTLVDDVETFEELVAQCTAGRAKAKA